MEAIKNVYSLEILNKSSFDDCKYLKLPIEFDYHTASEMSVTNTSKDVQKSHEIKQFYLSKDFDNKIPQELIKKSVEICYDKKPENDHSLYKNDQENDKYTKEIIPASDNKTQNHSGGDYINPNTTDSSNTSEDMQMRRFPKSGFLAKRPGYVFNYNEPPGMVVKHLWERRLDNLSAVTYMRDENGRLISNCIGYSPFNLAAGDASLQSFHQKSLEFANPWKKPLRLFDKQGKPLTDRIGRPLLDIFGVPKVLIDSEGRPICDGYGDPVFNALGVSTVYADTNPTISPINEVESGIPLLDITKKHVVFLYDSKGNPLTDFVGRPLLKSSGSALFGMPSKKSENQNYLKPLYGKSPIENVVRNIQIFDSDGNPLTDEEGVLLSDQYSCPKIVCNENGMPICDVHSKPLSFKYGKRISLHRGNMTDTNENSLRKIVKHKNSDTLSNLVEKVNSIIEKTIEDNYSSRNNKQFPTNKDNRVEIQSNICYRKQTYKTKKSKLLFMNKYFNKGSKPLSDNDFLHYYRKSIHSQISSSVYNEYGKPLRDHHNNFLYDKYGIPLTGENGVKLSCKARQILREKLKNVPIPNPKEFNVELKTTSESSFYDKYDSFGRPAFDKWGRPLYDLYGKLIYDSYGRPLTDAYGRPLTDSIGQPLLDSDGHILTARSSQNGSNPFLYDIFGRPTHDRFGNILFDIYGRPKYDIYTNSIYDNIGRPVTDANGIVLKDSSGNNLCPFPNKPLYKDTKKMLSIHIDKLLSMPIMNKIIMWKQQNLVDAFGGPLFDDFGRPMYSKFGIPLFDKYGRPLYNKNGKPFCDIYGRPLSEEIRSEPPQDTLSVIDSLKLLKLSGDTSKWMETNEYQLRFLTKNPGRHNYKYLRHFI